MVADDGLWRLSRSGATSHIGHSSRLKLIRRKRSEAVDKVHERLTASMASSPGKTNIPMKSR